jgi:hypothetical protein
MTSVRTQNFTYEALAYAISRTYVLGVGQTTAWNIESAPPNVDPSLSQVPELALLIPVVVKAAYWNPTGTVSVGNVHYSTAENLTDITTNQATRLLLTATLNHNDLPIASYRSLGLYLANPTGSGPWLPAAVPARKLVWLSYQPPTFKTPNLSEVIKVVC